METVFDKPLDTELSGKQNATDNALTTTAKTVVGAINENASGISSNSTAIAKVQNGLAYIVGNTNTTGGTIAVGQFVYVKGHSTIAEGLRTVTASISANGNITTSNTSACSDGGLNALNSKIATIKSSGSLHDLAGENGLFWLTSAVTDKPIANGGLFIIRSYGINYSTGEYISDNGEVWSITFVNNTWTYKQYQGYVGIKSLGRVTDTFTTGATGNIAMGVSNSTGKYTVVSPICTNVDAYCRTWIATTNNGWYLTLVNPNTGATINNTQVTITYTLIETY